MVDTDEHVLELVDPYLAGALLPGTAARVERHCGECPICEVALAEARRRMDAILAVPQLEASEELIRRTQARIDERIDAPLARRALYWLGERSRAQRIALAAGLAACLLACVHLYILNWSPSPYDLRIQGQSELMAGTQSSLRVVLLDRDDNAPVAGVAVEIALARNGGAEVVRLARFVTDANGTGQPRIQLPDWADGEYELRVAARGRVGEQLARTVKLKRHWQLMLSTDKPVYQPGQVVRMRSLALRRPDLKPVAGQQARYSITDPKGNVIFRRRGVTSRYGIASADCPLADELNEGDYRIECQVGDTTRAATVEVKQYVLPKFRVHVELDRPYYEPGEMLRGTIKADYFFGKAVGGAKVRLDLQTAEGRGLEARVLETDRDGTAEFSFRVPAQLAGREEDGGDARIRLEVGVEDSAGQRVERSVARRVTTRPLRVEVIPESGRLVLGLPNRIYFYASYADGRPARARLRLSGVNVELVTNTLGVARWEFTPEWRTHKLDVQAVDDRGRTDLREVTLSADVAQNDFLVRTDKAVYDGGDTLKLAVLGAGSQPVLLDFIKDGQTLLTETVDVREGRGDFELDLPPELFGTIQLCAYRLGGVKSLSRKTRLIYVRRPRDLDVRVALDRPLYRPGDAAKLQLSLVDGSGNPVRGAISLAAVDEAVFSVVGRRPGLENEFFTLEQELLQPVYALYPWSPGAAPAGTEAERNAWEQALFAAADGRPGDRDELLRELAPYLEYSEEIFDVLERPDWEEYAENVPLPPGSIELLRGSNAPHTLTASTYPVKEREVGARRRNSLKVMNYVWITLGLIAGFAWLAWADHRVIFAVLVLIGLSILVIALMLPAVQAAREAGRASAIHNEIRQLAFAVEQYKEVRGDLHGEGNAAATAPPRVRRWFPETLLWRPELITDDEGRAELEFDLADSITTWRLSASAVSAEGQLGASQADIRVFQPFFVDVDLPVALTRNDEVSVPVVVYNYLDAPQKVTVELEQADWFEGLDQFSRQLELSAGEVRSVHFPLRAVRVGKHELKIVARGEGPADAVVRPVRVLPDGQRVETVQSGTLQRPAAVALSVPEDAIPGSVKALVKIYPSSFSQLVEGLDGIFERPYGCFEQTSSTTYPNVLALDYLRRTGKAAPAIEAKAQSYIHLGYQRLLTFEVAGGGFDWFGNPPANRTLTAYGLMEFADMARVHDVDPQLIRRTRSWLLDQRRADGSWEPDDGGLWHDIPAGGGDLARLRTTAYIAWAVFGSDSRDAQPTVDFLRSYSPNRIDDAYTLALVANGLWAADPTGAAAAPYLERLAAQRQTSADGKRVHWSTGPGRTMFYGGGRGGDVETTATAVLALLRGGGQPETVRGALAWLVEQKDGYGTWHSTQATVLALKALIAGTGKSLGGGRPRRIDVALDGQSARQIVIPADQSDVLQQVDLSEQLAAGRHELTLNDRSGAGSGYQVSFRYHVPRQPTAPEAPPLDVALKFESDDVQVGEALKATCRVTNRMGTAAPMVILDLPVPAGFAPLRADFDKLRNEGRIAKYQVTARSVIVYLRALRAGDTIELPYRLQATMPVRVTTPAAVAYEYYQPEVRGSSQTAVLTAR